MNSDKKNVHTERNSEVAFCDRAGCAVNLYMNEVFTNAY